VLAAVMLGAKICRDSTRGGYVKFTPNLEGVLMVRRIIVPTLVVAIGDKTDDMCSG